MDGVLEQYIEWENDATFTDLSGNSHDATPTFRIASSDADVSASKITLDASGSMTVKSGGSMTLDAGGSMTVKAGGQMKLNASHISAQE